MKTNEKRLIKGKKEKRRTIILGILAVITVAMLCILLQSDIFNSPDRPDSEEDSPDSEQSGSIVAGDLFPGIGGDAKDGHLSGMTKEQIIEQMQKAADESQFSFKINSRPVFADGGSAGDLGIENPNYNVYPMVVQIFMNDTNEMIYDSGGILPNQHIDSAKLLCALGAGEYGATAVLNAYDPVSKIWQGKAQAALIITVQN